MLTFKGIATSTGIARGKVVLMDSFNRTQMMQTVSDVESEFQRVLIAIQTAKDQLNELYEKARTDIGESTAVIFNIHAMMLEDSTYLSRIHDIICHHSCSAEYAVNAVSRQLATEFNHMEDDYLRERAADIEDLSHRIIRILSGQDHDPFQDITGSVIIAAEKLLPSHTFQLDKSRILAFISQKGSMNCHASIMARSLGIPAVTALGMEYHQINSGDFLIVDGMEGVVICNPNADTMSLYDRKLEELNIERQRLMSYIGTKAVTKDGFHLEICANIGHTEEYKQALEMDADGIGLFRSEFLFLENSDFPTEETQFQAYKKVLEKMSPKRVVIRTLDFGADKQAPYFPIREEDNPALGYRAIRISLNHHELFIPQLRALLRASVYGHLAIMFPMITELNEVLQIKALLKQVKKELSQEGIAYSAKFEFGIMIETPAAVMIADLLAKEVDFFSIGTNDLTQYTLACDRMNPKVGYLYDYSNISVLRMIRQTVKAAHDQGIWVGICGESAANTELLPYYIAMEIDELSVPAQYVLKVKEVVQQLDQTECKEKYDES